MTGYSPLYSFLTYLQLANIVLTTVLLIIGILGGIFAIRALLIYIKKNSEPKAGNNSLAADAPGAFGDDAGEQEADVIETAESVEEVEAEVVYDLNKEEK